MKRIAAALLFAILGASTASATGDSKAEPAANRAHAVQTPFGIAGDARDAKRTIEIRMLDAMRFAPDTIDVRQGETIRLVLINTGKLPHELVIGTKKDLDRHAAMMMDAGMEHHDAHSAEVAPGESGEIVWKFNRAGHFDYACLVPGHFQAGMTGTIIVASR